MNGELQILEQKISKESVKQITRRILRLMQAQETLENKAEKGWQEKCRLANEKEEFLIEYVLKKMVAEGVRQTEDPLEYGEWDDKIEKFFEGVDQQAIWVYGNGEWC